MEGTPGDPDLNNPNDPDEVGSYNGHCAFWKAQVRSVYWCKSYAPTQEFLNQEKTMESAA